MLLSYEPRLDPAYAVGARWLGCPTVSQDLGGHYERARDHGWQKLRRSTVFGHRRKRRDTFTVLYHGQSLHSG